MDEWVKEAISVIAQHGPWAIFCFWLAFKHFQLQSQTIEVMTAIRTLIENLECRGGPRNVSE
jgi:hypothetical protein